jgi:tetratricopeptide (TPR) repeat protein
MQLAADADPSRSPEYHYALGRQHKANNDAVGAEAAYREALRVAPDFINAWLSLGILLRGLGRPDEAEQAQREALRLDPHSYLAHLNLGNALLDQQRPAEAADEFRLAIQLKVDSAEAQNNLGRALLLMDDPKCLGHFQAALRLKPDYFLAAEGLGTTLKRLGDYEAAARALRLATQLQPDAVEARLQLGDAYLATGKLNEAVREFEHLIHGDPSVPRAKAGLASALTLLGQYARPKALFREAIKESGEGDPTLPMCYAVFLLTCGDFGEAWRYYEARHLCPGGVPRNFPAPLWRDEPLEGRTLLITCEQGLGDELNFASVIPDAIAAAAHCIIECDVRLESLYRRSFPTATVTGIERKNDEKWSLALEARVDSIPKFDFWTHIGTLPLHFRTSADAFPKSGAYLRADPERVAYWRERLDALGPGLKVGISWRGGVALTNSVSRSLALKQLEPLFSIPGVQFVSLQYGDNRAELEAFAVESGHLVHLWQDAIDTYDETAALVSALDMVVTVATAIVHLAGALDRPVWVMTPLGAGWRYGRTTPTMAWYPSARVFRQEKNYVWDRVIANVKRGLQRVAKGEDPLTVGLKVAP